MYKELDSLHEKILNSKFAEEVTEQEILALVEAKEIRNKAIDEFAERIEKRIKEEASLLEQERNEAREYDDEQVIFAVNNQLRAFDYSLRVIAEELKGGAV